MMSGPTAGFAVIGVSASAVACVGLGLSAALRLFGGFAWAPIMEAGTSDDNVHMQNTIVFTNALINAGKQFDMQLYPQKTHGIGGLQARSNLFTRIVDQFEVVLGK